MDRYQYLLVLAACLGATAPLELLGARVYRRPVRSARAIVPVALVFAGWDVIAVAEHVWRYNPRYVTGWRLLFGLLGARAVGESVQWRQDCPRFAPGDFAGRPGVRTPVDGLVLAGDAIRIDLPVALMERAAATGWRAANELLVRWGLAGHEVYSVPTRGRLALLHALGARHGGAS